MLRCSQKALKQAEPKTEPLDMASIIHFLKFAQMPCPAARVFVGILARGTSIRFLRTEPGAWGYASSGPWEYDSSLRLDDQIPPEQNPIAIFTMNHKEKNCV